MPRQHVRHSDTTYEYTEEFPKRFRSFRQESGLWWSEVARRLGTYRNTIWRWTEGGSRPNYQHRRALLELANGLGLTPGPGLAMAIGRTLATQSRG